MRQLIQVVQGDFEKKEKQLLGQKSLLLSLIKHYSWLFMCNLSWIMDSNTKVYVNYLRRRIPLTVNGTGEVLRVFEMCKTDIPRVLFCLSVPLSLKVSLDLTSLYCLCVFVSLSQSVPWWSTEGDPEHKVSFSAKYVDTQCSLIFKLVNIDQWHHHDFYYLTTHSVLNGHTHTHVCTHAHTHSCQQPDRFTD